MRRQVATSVRDLLTDGAASRRAQPVPATASRRSRDPGLFGPQSVTWRVHADLSMLIGGVRALFVQTLHPLAMAGVAEHSSYRTDPLGRLARTGAFLATTTYGTSREAEQAIRRVRAVHRHVRGTAPDGRPYSATDPELLAWVHHVEVESFLVAYQRYGTGPRLAPEEADTYVEEMAAVARRLGVPDPETTAAGLHERVARQPDLRATSQAREAMRFLLVPPLPLAARPAYALVAAAAIGLVPWRTRLALRLPSLPLADPVVVQPTVGVLLGALGWALGSNPALAAAQARCT